MIDNNETNQKVDPLSTGTVITYFSIIFYLFTIGEFILFFGKDMDITSMRLLFFNLAVTLTYPFVYVVPGITLTSIAFALSRLFKLSEKSIKIITYSTMIVAAGVTMTFFFIDYKIYSMFSFHMNSFVLNLILTPGGIDSMGASTTDFVVFMLLFLFSFGIASGLLWIAYKLRVKYQFPLRQTIILISSYFLLLVALSIAEKVEYAYSTYTYYPQVYANSKRVPFYAPVRMGKIFRKMNIKEVKRDDVKLNHSVSLLQYPLAPLQVEAPSQKFNIVWLVAESWRGDTLTPEIMPATSEFAKQCVRFKKHYSSGNGTRMALFGMFYGLYGSYWKAALGAGKPPVIMDVLKKQNYQFDMYTSAKFTYPEFDKTIFVNIPKEHLHQSAGRGGFINDKNNISSILSFIKHRDPNRPFMTFMFFESPHAPYTFPNDCVIRKDYLPTFNYSTVDVPANIEKIKNRYINSVHHLDTQLARVFKFLKDEKLLDNTIVLVTGDHGEEFLEKGHWGHNKGFHEEEITPPMMIYVPGETPRDITTMSSHLDVPAMIAPLIGIKNRPFDFSLGYNFLKGQKRDYAACASWSELCYIDNLFKYVIEPTGYNILTTVDDGAVSKEDKSKLNKAAIFDMMKNASRFYQK